MALKTVQVVVNGVTTQLSLNPETGKYEATLTAPEKSSYNQPDHYYDVTVTALDQAGNSVSANSKDAELGEKLRLSVLEKTPPAITITEPTESQLLTNNQPTIKFSVMDNDSGVNPEKIMLIVNGTEISGITKTQTTGGYNCQYAPEEPLPDGKNEVIVKATDYDGNEAEEKKVTFTIDTVPPELSVTAPVDGFITNRDTVTVEGTTNDVTSSPVTLTVNGEDVTVYSDGTFSTTVSLDEGDNTITVISTDGAGRSTEVVRKVVKDTVPPVISDVSLAPNPADIGTTYLISVDVSD